MRLRVLSPSILGADRAPPVSPCPLPREYVRETRLQETAPRWTSSPIAIVNVTDGLLYGSDATSSAGLEGCRGVLQEPVLPQRVSEQSAGLCALADWLTPGLSRARPGHLDRVSERVGSKPMLGSYTQSTIPLSSDDRRPTGHRPIVAPHSAS
jgi:hypothetical protein